MALTTIKYGEASTVFFNDPKSELMHYHSKRNINNTSEAKGTSPNGTVIQVTKIQHWLRVWMKRKLNFKYLIKIKAPAAMRAFITISKLANCHGFRLFAVVIINLGNLW